MTRKVIDSGKRSKTLSEVKPRDKSRAKGSLSFTETARPCIWVMEFFWNKGRYHLMMMLLMMMMSCFVVWLTDERLLALFHARTTVRDPHHRQYLQNAVRRIWTCPEFEFRLSWMKLCRSDNHYNTKFVSHRLRMSGESNSKKDSHLTKLERRPRM